ncbi:hydroxylysine kinase-like [Mya arenaria]|uniref:hydroxylysine kinase-like n=1 Tax=Mya arenaria TaxID=6604 RepID=UPI0022E79FA0|nr:hydroxylysine kinase-like [Mya arenaria]XP_052773484.1 hydroxylysine kinase-like [Mya arenaria]XP_052773485.1 hydroxylysine kinase-like [Mya arenaria]
MERPVLEEHDVMRVVFDAYGMRVTKQMFLDSYDDVNILVHVSDLSTNENIVKVSPNGYVFKVLNTVDSKREEFVDVMHGAIECVARAEIVTSRPVLTKDGRQYILQRFPNKTGETKEFLVRLFEFVPGETLDNKPYTADLCFQVGMMAAKIDRALKDFYPDALKCHTRHWNLREVGDLGSLVDVIDDGEDRKLIRDVIREFKTNVLENSQLQRGAIHGDLNEGNIIVRRRETQDGTLSTTPSEYGVIGVLDFGDLVYEYHVFEISITMAYMMIESKHGLDPLDAGGHVLAGYLSVFDLNGADTKVIKECIAARLAQSFTYGALEHKKNPSNTYCLKTADRGWPVLRKLWSMSKKELFGHWNEILKCYDIKSLV